MVVAMDECRHQIDRRLQQYPDAWNKWWIFDRVEARWCGDDASEYPDWYPATIREVYPPSPHGGCGSVYLFYDTGEVDVVPVTKIRRIRSAWEGLSAPRVRVSQPPLFPIQRDMVRDILWRGVPGSADGGMVSRLVTLIEKYYANSSVKIWRHETGGSGAPFWWHADTKKIRLCAPGAEERNEVRNVMPDEVRELRLLVDTADASSLRKVKKHLVRICDLIKAPALRKAVGIDDSKGNEWQQKALDLLVLYMHTENYFLMSEPALLGEREGKMRVEASPSRVNLSDETPHEHSSSPLSSSRRAARDVVSSLLKWVGEVKEDKSTTAAFLGSFVLPELESVSTVLLCDVQEYAPKAHRMAIRPRVAIRAMAC